MRILHVNKFLHRRGGAEAYLLDLAELQRARGDEVEFFAMRHPDNEPSPHERWFPREVVLDPVPPGVVDRLRVAGRMVWSSSSRRGIGAVADACAPDVVHLHNVYHQLSPSIIGPVVDRGLPVVLTAHDYKLACPSYQLLANGTTCDACVGASTLPAVRRRCKDGSLVASALLAFEAGLHRRIDAYAGLGAIVAPSRFLAELLQRAGVPADRIHHVPHFATAVDAEPPDVDVRPADRPGATGATVVYAGRLSREKGVDVLVAAMAAVPDATLVIAGDGPERSTLEAAARPAGDRIRFVGRLDRAEVHRLIVGARCTVLPARWHENQPMSVLESFALGVPVIASDLGGLPELVLPDRTGVLVPAEDADALAAAIRRLVADPAEARRLGDGARHLVDVQHRPAVHLAALDEVYAAAAGAARRRGVGRAVGATVAARRSTTSR